jgi:alkanesulfonate monooxygenase SsuD/methylene tetrahydromethanopterin reductase-like flavin-dependent oxidoreductase (luciferase family)
VAGDSEEQIAAGVDFVRQQIGFYGSTPAYRPVLETHGWGSLQDELHALTKRGAWNELADVIDNEMLHTFAIIGTPEEAVAEIKRRYGGIATRVTLPLSDDTDPARRRSLLETLRAAADA